MKISLLKRAIITGGTGGLGSALTSVFNQSGWEIVQLGRKDLDLSASDDVAAFFRAKPCDLLICAAGCIEDMPITRMDEGAWDKVFGLNFEAAALCARAAIPCMADHGGGHVVFISSHAAIHPSIGQVAYAAAKASLLGLTIDLAERWDAQGIRVNAVMPGFLETAMTARVSPKRKQAVLAEHHLGQLNTPEIAAKFIHFLDETMVHTSGQVFQLDSRRGFF